VPSHLLVVDDDRTLVRVLHEVLVRRFPGATVETCTSADRSLERIAAEDFDTIISDVRMPGTDGLALLRQAHDLRPTTPIVLITGLGDYDLAVRALRGGAFDFITKPVDTDYLAASVARALRVREVERQLEAQTVALAKRAAALAHIVEDQTHELREANRMKDEFLATLSHELRTPLTSILGWSRLLLRNELDAAMKKEALGAIERNASHQARLVDDLLDVSRIMTGKLRISRKALQLGPIAAGAADAITPALRARNITLERDIDMTNTQVNGDADRLQQVVSNLLSNAAKFTPEGGRIVVRLQRDKDVTLTVTDTGVGIAADFLPSVFTRFRQADASLSRSSGGLGVGLSLVKHFVELHGGNVAAESAGVGMGATFIVRIPATNIVQSVDPPRSESHHDLAGVHVLVVEDDEDSRSFLRFTLESSGARVTEAPSVAAGLTAMDHGVPDVVLCDISMPDEDGYSFIRRMRARSTAAGGRVVAAAVTACARPEDVRRALAEGFDVHLAKPLEPSKLTDALTRLLEAGRKSTT
jgi:signal transduction histidine kinase